MKIGVLTLTLLACMGLLALPLFAAGVDQGRQAAGDQQNHTMLASMFPSSGIYVVTVDGGQIMEMKRLSDALPAVAKTDSPAQSASGETKVDSGPYSSLIIDARGCGVDRAMSPKVRKADGSEVWGTLSVTPDFAIENGVVSYATSMEMALKSSRCGKNPMVIKASGKCAGQACDVMISDEDSSRVASENAVTKFLDKCKVVFIVD